MLGYSTQHSVVFPHFEGKQMVTTQKAKKRKLLAAMSEISRREFIVVSGGTCAVPFLSTAPFLPCMSGYRNRRVESKRFNAICREIANQILRTEKARLSPLL